MSTNVPRDDIYRTPYYAGEESTSKECKTLSEIAQMKKPAFNAGTGREATVNSTGSSFNPGPGSYSTRISSIKTQFVKKEWNKEASKKHIRDSKLSPVNQLSNEEEAGGDQLPFFYVKERGGYVKHYQPLAVDRLQRTGCKEVAGSGIGPAYYKTESGFTSSFAKPPK